MVLELLGDGWTRRIEAGERVAFGRTGSDEVGIGLGDDARLHRRCGSIVVDDHGWELVNDGRWLRIRVVSLDRFGVDSVGPAQRIRVPWPRTRVQVHVGDRSHDFVAEFAAGDPGASVPQPPGGEVVADDATAIPVRVDRSSGYFRALVALCEPQLRDPSTSTVATDHEIARRLNRSGRERSTVSGKTVERRLDACRIRFGLKVTDEYGLSAGLERRDARRVLVDVALLTATVTRDDLAVLVPTAGEGVAVVNR